MHTGSLATALAPGWTAVVAFLEQERLRGRVTLSYDPNVRPALLETPEAVRSGSSSSPDCPDVVKVSNAVELPRELGPQAVEPVMADAGDQLESVTGGSAS